MIFLLALPPPRWNINRNREAFRSVRARAIYNIHDPLAGCRYYAFNLCRIETLCQQKRERARERESLLSIDSLITRADNNTIVQK